MGKTIKGSKSNDTLNGSAKDDKIKAKQGDDLLFGNDGKDKLYGEDGNDTLDGGAGNDVLDGGKGDDLLLGGAGDDELKGKDGNDTLGGGAGDDELDGDKGNDVLSGGDGADHIDGGKDNDHLSGNSGTDMLIGGKGDDTLAGGAGKDILIAGQGVDTVVVEGDVRDFDFAEIDLGGKSSKKNDDDDDDDQEDALEALFADFLGVTEKELDKMGFDKFGHDDDDDDDDYDPGENNLWQITETATGDADIAQDVERLQFDNYTVELDGSNNPILTEADTLTFDEDNTGSSVDVMINDWDFERDELGADVAFELVSVDGADYRGDLSFDPATGVITFTPDNESYQYLAVGEVEEHTLEYVITDGADQSTGTLYLTITGTNDVPEVAAALADTTDEDAPELSVDLLEGASDVDASDILNAIDVAQTSGRTVAFTVVNNILFFDSSDFQDLATGESEDIVFDFSIDDGNGGTVDQTLTITVEGRNDAPFVAAARSQINHSEDDTPYSTNLLQGIADVDGSDVLNAINVVQTEGRDITFTVVDNILTFDTDAFQDMAVGETEEVRFTYTVDDGNGGTLNQTLLITMEGRNDGPEVAGALFAGTDEDAASIDIDLLEGASDIDASDILNAVEIAQIAGRTVDLTVANNVLTFDSSVFQDLAVGETEDIVFAYSVDDGNGGTVDQTVTITVEGRNDAPIVAAALGTTTTEDDGVLEVDLLDGASDVDASDILNTLDVQQTSGRSVAFSVVDNQLAFDAGAFNDLAVGESEDLRFSFTISDGNGGTIEQMLDVTVFGENDAPVVAETLHYETDEDADPLTIDLLQEASDADTTDTLNISAVRQVEGASVSFELVGNSVVIDPTNLQDLDTGDWEFLVFEYDVDDGNGGVTTATLNVDVEGLTDIVVTDYDTDVTFLAEDQNMWQSGPASIYQQTDTITMVDMYHSGNIIDVWFDTLLGTAYSIKMGVTYDVEVGVISDLEMNGGSVDASIPFNVQAQTSYNAQTDTLTITSFNLDTVGEDEDQQGGFQSYGPGATYTLSLYYDVSASLGLDVDRYAWEAVEWISNWVLGVDLGHWRHDWVYKEALVDIHEGFDTGYIEQQIVTIDTADIGGAIPLPKIGDYVTLNVNWPHIDTTSHAVATDGLGDFESFGTTKQIIENGRDQHFFQLSVDVDQILAKLVNSALGNGSDFVLNPFNLSVSLKELLEKGGMDPATSKLITDVVNVDIGFELLDFELFAAFNFEQDLHLSADEIVAYVEMEDGTLIDYTLGEELDIANASSYDVNGDGVTETSIVVDLQATLNNNVDLVLDLGYTLELVKAWFQTKFFGVATPKVVIGPLATFDGSVPVASIDIFDSTFDFDFQPVTIETPVTYDV